MAEGLSGEAALSVMNASNRGYGYDNMMNGEWFWMIIILFAFWGRQGINGNGLQENIDSRFVERDIFNTNQNVSNTACQTQRDVLENRYTNQLGVQQIISSQKDCCCETNRNIDSVRYDALLNAKDAQMQLSDCCCRLEAAGLANTQKVLDKLCSMETQDLRDRLATANNALTVQTIIGQTNPRPIPAYPVSSPYVSTYGFGCGCNYNTSCCGNAI